MRNVCFLSMDDLGGYVSDDELAIKPLNELGWSVEAVSWRVKDTDWAKFAAIIIRTTWDYHLRTEEFLQKLKEIEDSGARLENPLKIVEWNLNKNYLAELEEKGVKIVPTDFSEESIDENVFKKWQARFDAEELIIKPAISATAKDTFRLKEFSPDLTGIFSGRKYLVQPFMNNISSEGEYSLFYFGGRFSHAILKTPKPKDFRVQEEWGGIITRVEPSEKLLKAGKNALQSLEQTLLYARADFVRDNKDEFALMELELIEPALYFRMNEKAPRLFAETFDEWMKRS